MKDDFNRVLRKRRFVLVAALCLSLAGLTIFQVATLRPSKVAPAAGAILASEGLKQLPVKEAEPRTNYSRENFGGSWQNFGGCDTRNLILQRDLTNPKLASDKCTVISGLLKSDPYTGKTISFKRGPGTSSLVQIDHIVAVSDAWQKGARYLEPRLKVAFYNDGLNLIAVDATANKIKSDADASGWLPTKSYRCRYVARQIAVKIKYLLWVSAQEANAMKDVLSTCPSQVLPQVSDG